MHFDRTAGLKKYNDKMAENLNDDLLTNGKHATLRIHLLVLHTTNVEFVHLAQKFERMFAPDFLVVLHNRIPSFLGTLHNLFFG